MDVHCPAATSPEAFFDKLETPISLYSSSSSCSRSSLSSESDVGSIDQDEGQDVEYDGEDYTPLPRSPFVTMRAHLGDVAGSMPPTTPKFGSSLHSFSLSRLKSKSAPSSPQNTVKLKPSLGVVRAMPFFRRKVTPPPPIRISAPTAILIPTHIHTRDLGTLCPPAKAGPRTSDSDSSTAPKTPNTDAMSTYTSTHATSTASSSGLYPISHRSAPHSAPCLGEKSPMRICEGRINEWVSSQMSLPLPPASPAPDAAATATRDGSQTKDLTGREGVKEIPVLAGMFAEHMQNERTQIQQIAKRVKRVPVNYSL